MAPLRRLSRRQARAHGFSSVASAKMTVGSVAMRNFKNVGERFRNIVLRADVGVTEEAWEVREEQLTRVRRLRIERARGEKLLQDELSEVLDDSGDSEAQP